MIVVERKLTVRDLVDGYNDNGEGGVSGYGGKLDIRPAYQREFVYKDKQRDAVILSIRDELPLNTMYWADIGDERFEVIDGQQRTVSICQYVVGDFSIDGLAFHNLQSDQKEKILNYPLMVYVCKGTDSERLKWFKIINIAGELLSEQELRNAVYHGPWLSDAKRYFSRSNSPAKNIGSNYLSGSPIRQEYLETAIKWINEGDIVGYMSKHQNDKRAIDLWNYFRSVIDWVAATFPNHRSKMKSVEWGQLYNKYKDMDLDPIALEKRVKKLFLDDDISNKAGIYYYVLDGNESRLNIRKFSEKMRIEAFERQNGICPICNEGFEIEMMEADHIMPWSENGKTNADNCQMLCKQCNRRKSNK